MSLAEKRVFLIKELIAENILYNSMEIPESESDQIDLLRALLNVRVADKVSESFLNVQDEYLKERIRENSTGSAELEAFGGNLFLWQGDITTLKVDAIVNAANSGLTGCYMPNHKCIDNCIHTYAGVQLRLDCAKIMEKQGHPEPTGKAKITSAYNLPSKYVIHTVGPIVQGKVTDQNKSDLASCYKSCLELADEKGLESIAFCCISTGVFGYPNDEAVKVAVDTVKSYKVETGSHIKVIFNVFLDIDYKLYKEYLGLSK